MCIQWKFLFSEALVLVREHSQASSPLRRQGIADGMGKAGLRHLFFFFVGGSRYSLEASIITNISPLGILTATLHNYPFPATVSPVLVSQATILRPATVSPVLVSQATILRPRIV